MYLYVHERIALSREFRKTIETVIGPTPPGTGVIAEATFLTSSKSTSPTSLIPFGEEGSLIVLIPTSTTTAPCLIHSLRTYY